jgi:hypothetical protein
MVNKVPGYVSDVHFRNVVLAGDSGSYRIQISGADEQHDVRNVSFENVKLAGEKLADGSKRLEVGPHVSGLHIRN